MKTKTFLVLVILLILSGNLFAQKQSATAFVESFYEFHRARTEGFNAEELEARKKWFTAELYELFQNELKREAEYLKENPTDKPFFGDGFPFAPMEECYVEGKEIKNILKVGKTSGKEGKTLVEIKFYYPKACEGNFIHAYKIELVKNERSWLINDLIYLNDQTMREEDRLTTDLKREKY